MKRLLAKLIPAKRLLTGSKMAFRLVRISVFLVSVPLIVTVIILAYVGQEQMRQATRAMETLHSRSVAETRQEYQHLGEKALHESSRQTQTVSMEALQSVSQKIGTIQDTTLASIAHEFTLLTDASFKGAMQQSLATNRSTLDGVRTEMTHLFARSAQKTQRSGAVRIEKAMLAQVDALMKAHATQIAGNIQSHIDGATDLLTLAAQMPAMRNGKADGQKMILDGLVRRFPQMIRLTVLDKHGIETARSEVDRVVTDADLSRQPEALYFKTALTGKEYLGVDPISVPNAPPTLQIAVPIEIYRGKVVGVLAARYAMADLWDAIRNTRIGRTGFAFVQDGRRRPLLAPKLTSGVMLTSGAAIERLGWQVIVAMPRNEAMLPIQELKRDIQQNANAAQRDMRHNIEMAAGAATQRLQNSALTLRRATTDRVQLHTRQVLARARNTTRGQIQVKVIGLKRAIQTQTAQTQHQSAGAMAGAAAVAADRLTRRVQPLTQHILQRARQNLFTITLAILIVCCVLGSVLVSLTATRIVRPVVDLAQMAHAIADGDLEKRADERAPDEVGDLALAFNTMASSLLQSRQELQTAEGQLVQSAKLASLGTLSAGVAHELNQPLAIIRSLVQLLEDEPGLTEDVKADLKRIEGQTGRMIKIIRHMRTFCRTGGGEMVPVEVDRVLQDCFMLIGEQLRTHNVEVEFELCADPVLIKGDANELEQVFLNLVANARDALDGRPDARITLCSRIEERKIEGGRTDGGRYVLEIRDNGTGIPADILGSIFDPFFTTKEPGKGTGLGLSISHSIIARHNGTLTAHNEQGAVFTITIPLLEQERSLMELPQAA